jgi:hypothetical protein
MKLSCALVACNDNPKYLDFWPIVRQSWWDIVGIPAVMIYIGDEKPDAYKDDPSVICFKPIEGWSTVTQAQVIRLLYPALLQCNGAVVISDMDMIPLQREYFTEGFAKFREEQFVSLRGIDEQERQIYMCYCGATPQTWSDLFNIKSFEDITSRMKEWSQQMPLQVETHAAPGWCFDQQKLYEHVQGWLLQSPDRVGLLPWTREIPRLDRTRPDEWRSGNPFIIHMISRKDLVDFHMPPYEYFSKEIYEKYEYAKMNYTL